jgi:hypothetical protein
MGQLTKHKSGRRLKGLKAIGACWTFGEQTTRDETGDVSKITVLNAH